LSYAVTTDFILALCITAIIDIYISIVTDFIDLNFGVATLFNNTLCVASITDLGIAIITAFYTVNSTVAALEEAERVTSIIV
jgi:hypothetical protein